jgi:hypothetical protein
MVTQGAPRRSGRDRRPTDKARGTQEQSNSTESTEILRNLPLRPPPTPSAPLLQEKHAKKLTEAPRVLLSLPILFDPPQTPLPPQNRRNTRQNDLTEGNEEESNRKYISNNESNNKEDPRTDSDSSSNFSSESDGGEASETSKEESDDKDRALPTMEELFLTVWRSPRKSAPSRKIIEARRTYLRRLPNNLGGQRSIEIILSI